MTALCTLTLSSVVCSLRVIPYAQDEEVKKNSRIPSGVRFLTMDGLPEALDVPRNREPNGTCVGIFWGGSNALKFSEGSSMHKRVRGSFSQTFSSQVKHF